MRELRVKEILNQRGISVREFAKMIGVSREHCYSILNGKSLSQKRMETMAKVLNIPVSSLFKNPKQIQSKDDPYSIVFGRTEEYQSNDIITFCKLHDDWGEFSNMSTAYSVECCGYHFKTSEHLFIALRFSGHDELQKQIMEYNNAMYCKKKFVNGKEYKKYHHPHWHDNLYDVEVMKFVISLKYEQNEGFRQLLEKTRGKIIVEDATAQNSNDSVLRWGCQDLQRKDVVKEMRSKAKKYINQIVKEDKKKTASLKKPRSKAAQEKHDVKLNAQIQAMEKLLDICEDSICKNCNYALKGQNSMGKILTIIRDNGRIDYDLPYPLYLFGHEIPKTNKL